MALQFDHAPPATNDAERAKREKLELIKLRHEVRELRENMLNTPGGKPGGLRGQLVSILSAPPSTKNAAVNVRPEWKRMEAHASNQYTRAMQDLNSRTNEFERFLFLNEAARMSFALGHTDDARRLITEMMTLNDKYSRGDPEKTNADAVHRANIILGQIAVEEGRLGEAKRHLLAAGSVKTSPVLGSFGPNMSLAKDLLEKGEQETVLEYFELCRSFWGMEQGKLDEWKRDVEAGRIPKFGASLIR